MDIDKTLEDLRKASGASRTFALRLRPLVERAAVCSPAKRARLLGIVARSLRADAKRTRQARAKATGEELAGSLGAVADILHQWNPPAWLSVWEQQLRRRDSE